MEIYKEVKQDFSDQKPLLPQLRQEIKYLNVLEDLHLVTATHAAKCALKLRQQGSYASLLTVLINFHKFFEHDRQYTNSKTQFLPAATNSDIELIHYANIALKAIYRDGY
ncbi:hypothetical protein ACFS7Z_24295 [Pontibacter toksunensis]|uniref:DNA polymerase Y-family little finger domain-containing protein n=1 Tax=Pontibacter toksunensis TaxID=1332631 RepID=A0ABW6C219_9BACT